MIDGLETVKHHPAIQELADIIATRCNRTNSKYHRIVVANFLGELAGTMRVKVDQKGKGNFPCNVFAIPLAPSGYGKGYSVHICTTEIFGEFREHMQHELLPALWERQKIDIAQDRALQPDSKGEEHEAERLQSDYDSLGEYVPAFLGATDAAVEQMYKKLCFVRGGAMNLRIDELGQNLEKSTTIEPLRAWLELYDSGKYLPKLTKNTKENKRISPPEDTVPCNTMLFGEPNAIFDGSTKETLFLSLLQTGFARRSLFGWGEIEKITSELTPEERAEAAYNARFMNHDGKVLANWSSHFLGLGAIGKLDYTVRVPEDVDKLSELYRVLCTDEAVKFGDHFPIQRSEMEHRYMKALRLAGIFAFVDETPMMTRDHMLAAIKLVEESAEALNKMLNQEPNHARVARYICESDGPLTSTDLQDKLKFFPTAASNQAHLLQNAINWGYKNNHIITQTFEDGIKFFDGQTPQPVSLDDVMLSASTEFGHGYTVEREIFSQEDEPLEKVAFSDLHHLFTADGWHWSNHYFRNGHRHQDDLLPGFNLAVFDVDGTASLKFVHGVLSDYTFMTYTTKRHTDDCNRFRLVMPISHKLELSRDDYRVFMENMDTWLPFDVIYQNGKQVDGSSLQPEKKWMTNPKAQVHYNEGEIVDIFPFIPKTSRCQDYHDELKSVRTMDGMERWFAREIANGNRNNMLYRFAKMLADDGMQMSEVEKRLKNFNAKLSDRLTNDELDDTILKSIYQSQP